MTRRKSMSKSERATPAGSTLLSLCQRITEQGTLTEDGIKELIRWLRTNRDAVLPAKDFLMQTVAPIVADRRITRDELSELHRAIESVMPSDVRKHSVQRRKERADAKRGIVRLTGPNGKKYQLHTLVGLIEYGQESLDGMATRLGSEIATVVAQQVKARERQFTAYLIRETEGGAWLFRSVQGGDFFVPAQSTRIVSGTLPGPVVIALSPSMAADIDRQTTTPRNMLEFTTHEVAQRFNVSVDTVRKWIRDGHLGAGSVGNGSAAFEYRIPEEELQRFANQFNPR